MNNMHGMMPVAVGMMQQNSPQQPMPMQNIPPGLFFVHIFNNFKLFLR